ncbi:MAG TPA: hypothetical protein VGO62_20270 [Myxococcota bacterium]
MPSTGTVAPKPAPKPNKPAAPPPPAVVVTGPDLSTIPGIDVGNIVTQTGKVGLDAIIDRVEHGGPGAANIGSDVITGMRDKLVEATWSEIAKERDLSLLTAKLTTLKTDLGNVNGSLGIKISEQLVRGDDASINKDPEKKAQTAAMSADPKQVVWLKTGGVTNLGAGFTTPSIPIAGTGGLVKVNLGFNASAALEYSQMSPFSLSPAGVIDGAVNAAVTLPISADTALLMKRGSQMTLTGTGNASLSGGITAGVSTSLGPITGLNAGVTAGVNGSATVSGNFKVDIERLDGSKVRVNLSTVLDRKLAANASVDAGITLDANALIDKTLGGTFPLDERKAAPIAMSDLTQPGKLADGILGTLERGGISTIESTVKSYTAFHAGVGATTQETNSDMVSFVFDLSNPAAKQAYNDLLRLNESSAAAVANRPDSGVKRNEMVDHVVQNGTNGSITFAGQKLLIASTLRKEEDGTLTTGHDVELIRSSQFKKDYTGIITGNESVTWESVQVKPQGQPASTFFHLAFDRLNKVMDKKSYTDFLNFAQTMGVKDATAGIGSVPDLDLIQRLFSTADDGTTSADVYFTDAGLKKIAQASIDKNGVEVLGPIMRAYAPIAQQLDPSLGNVPINAQTMDFADRFNEELRLANMNAGDPDSRFHTSPESDAIALDYQKKTGRDLSKDAAVYGGAHQLFDMSQAMRQAGDEKGWTKALVDFGGNKKFDFITTIAVLAKLAGPDDTLVHKLALDGGGLKLNAKDEGSLKGPDAQIAAATTGDH